MNFRANQNTEQGPPKMQFKVRGQLELAVISAAAKQVSSWKMVDCQADKLSCPSLNCVQPQITLAPSRPAPWPTPASCL